MRVDIEVCPPPQNITQLASTILVLTVRVCVVFDLSVQKEEMSLGTRLCSLMTVTHEESVPVKVWSLNVLITSTILEYGVQMS